MQEEATDKPLCRILPQMALPVDIIYVQFLTPHIVHDVFALWGGTSHDHGS